MLDKPVVFSYNDYNNDKRSEGDKVPFPTFQRAAGWCKAVLGFGQLAPEQPAEKELSAVGRDGILPLQRWVFAVMDKIRPILKVGVQPGCRQ